MSASEGDVLQGLDRAEIFADGLFWLGWPPLEKAIGREICQVGSPAPVSVQVISDLRKVVLKELDGRPFDPEAMRICMRLGGKGNLVAKPYLFQKGPQGSEKGWAELEDADGIDFEDGEWVNYPRIAADIAIDFWRFGSPYMTKGQLTKMVDEVQLDLLKNRELTAHQVVRVRFIGQGNSRVETFLAIDKLC